MEPKLFVATKAFIVYNNKVLILRESIKYQEGTNHGKYDVVGGRVKPGQRFDESLLREIKEETGLEIANVRLATVTNDIFEAEQKHYVTLYLLADYTGGAPTVREPEKCTGWQWFDWHALPKPLFLPVQNLLKTGFKPF